MAERSTIFIDNKVLSLLFKGTVSNEQANAVQLPVLLQPNGTLRGWDIQVGEDADGRERPALVNLNRIIRMQPYEPYEEIVVTNLGIVWTVCAENTTAGSLMRVWVEIWKYYFDDTIAGVDIRFDDGGATHEIVHDLQIMRGSPGAKFGPYNLTNGWSIDMRTNVADRCRCVATIEEYGMDAL